MNILDYCGALDLELELYHNPRAASKWIAKIRKSFYEISFKNSYDDCMQRFSAGYGQTTEESVKNLCENLKEHKYIVIDPSSGASSKERNKLPLPELEY